MSLWNICIGFIEFALSIKISKIQLPVIFISYYLLKLPLTTQDCLTIYSFFISDTIFFKDSLFLSAVIEWSNHLSIRNSEILSIFKKISCNLQSLLLATHTTALTLMESNILKAKSWFKSSL